LITSGLFYFFLKPKSTENFEKKKSFFLVFVYKIL
ncbi:unnamed protein product, partial [Staurois parvus]